MPSSGNWGDSAFGNPAAFARLLARVNNRPEPAQALQPLLNPDPAFMVARARDGGNVTNPTIRSTNVTTQQVTKKPFPGGKSVKARQNWKYPGGNIVRAPSVVINGRKYTDPKESDRGDVSEQGHPTIADTEGTPRRKQESNFFITLNPNRVFQNAEAARKQFIQALQHLQAQDTIIRCLKFGPKDTWYANDKAIDVIEPGIDVKSTVETGEKQNRMHSHLIIYINHYSQIQFSPQQLQYEFRTAFNSNLYPNHPMALTDNPYVQIKMLPQSDWATIMHQYIKKGMDAS